MMGAGKAPGNEIWFRSEPFSDSVYNRHCAWREEAENRLLKGALQQGFNKETSRQYKHLKTDSKPHVLIEGRETDNWLCIDFGNIVIHFMLPETREIYELEKLWTLRAYDDQLAQMVPESLPNDFIFGMSREEQ